MVFSSLLFVFLFFALNLASQAALRGVRQKNIAMLLFSMVFFSWAGPRYVVLLLLDTALCWFFAIRVEREPQHKKLYLSLCVALVLLVVYVVELVVKGLMHQCLGVYFPLIALNSAVLGLALEAGAKGYSYGQTLAAALGVGLGFLVALLLMNGVQSRIEEKHIPAAFRGLPISLLAASIIAMVLVAFK